MLDIADDQRKGFALAIDRGRLYAVRGRQTEPPDEHCAYEENRRQRQNDSDRRCNSRPTVYPRDRRNLGIWGAFITPRAGPTRIRIHNEYVLAQFREWSGCLVAEPKTLRTRRNPISQIRH